MCFTHREFDALLAAADTEETRKRKTLAVVLRNVVPGIPASISRAMMRHAKQIWENKTTWSRGFGHRNIWFAGSETSPSERVLDGILQTNCRRADHRKAVAFAITVLWQSCGGKGCGRDGVWHLRTMDVDRQHLDRNTGQFLTQNYDVWVWAKGDR